MKISLSLTLRLDLRILDYYTQWLFNRLRFVVPLLTNWPVEISCFTSVLLFSTDLSAHSYRILVFPRVTGNSSIRSVTRQKQRRHCASSDRQSGLERDYRELSRGSRQGCACWYLRLLKSLLHRFLAWCWSMFFILF